MGWGGKGSVRRMMVVTMDTERHGLEWGAALKD